MQTKRLYLEHSYITEFEATIIHSSQQPDSLAVELDRTAFYPTSGGQMFDMGFINGIRVKEVIEEENKIYHLLESSIDEKYVNCQIDWFRRFDFMQQHTGFHILAQSFLRELEAETLSSHLGEEISTIDVNIDKIDVKQIQHVEKLANQLCFEDRNVKQFFISADEIEKYDLRAMPTKNEKIRINCSHIIRPR